MSYANDDTEEYEPDHEPVAEACRQWARDLLQQGNFVILDSETTGLDHDSEPVEIAVLSPTGEVLLETLCRPLNGFVPLDAAALHGITTERLQAEKAPSWAEVYPRLRAAVGDKLIVCYNASYDHAILSWACRQAGLEMLPNRWECAMLRYSAYVGHWSRWHGSYRWQKLPHVRTKAHGASEDCRAVLALLRKMAGVAVEARV